VLAMFRNGDLDLIQLHLMSMQQIEPLVAKIVASDIATEKPAKAEKPANAEKPAKAEKSAGAVTH
jgi:hypothetical protein